MADYEPAFNRLLEHEGGYTVDHAGPTKYGITLRVLDVDIDGDGDIDASDISALTPADAKEFYHRHWWMNYRYYAITNQEIATKVLDLSVNMGPKQAHRLVQRALRSCDFNVIEDGYIGPKTLDAINDANPNELLAAIRSEAAGFYRLIAEKQPNYRRYLIGWLNRAYA